MRSPRGALGFTRKVIGQDKSVVFSAEYDPFGVLLSSSTSESFRFTGENHDDKTGLVTLRARQYDPEIGRFASADPVLGSPGEPQTLNRYAYVLPTPLTFTDPSGPCPHASKA